MQALQYDQTVNLTLRNEEYILHGFIDPNGNLVVEAELKSNGSRWLGRFSPADLEDLTRKTGNFKKFLVFVKMLSTALLRASDTVFVDMFTYEDLEALRKKSGEGQSKENSRSKGKSKKRYLILTYIVEFDKVHYPLRLKYDESPDPKRLMGTISKLREEIEVLRSSGQPSMAKLKAEMYRLQEENKSLKSSLEMKKHGAKLNEKNDKLVASLEEEVFQLREDLEKRNALIKSLTKSQEKGDNEKIKSLEQKRWDLQQELEEERGKHEMKMQKLQNSLKSAKAEIVSLQDSQQKSRVQIRKLKAELRALGRSGRGRKSTPSRGTRFGPPSNTKTRRKSTVSSSRPRRTATRQRSSSASRPRSADSTKSHKLKRGFSFSKSSRFGRSSSRPSSRNSSRPNSRSNSRTNSRSNSRANSRPSSRNSSRTRTKSRKSSLPGKDYSRVKATRKSSIDSKGSSYHRKKKYGSSATKKKVGSKASGKSLIDPPSSSAFNPQSEIDAIDDRINALEKFLRSAKTSSS
mmetsp:Transcript_9497/g.14255  ORF Transcript_9497/g.14255 Transcript_9497/m.14255 type:complete len:519 (-) Transcript_9497:66-1622(-)